MQFEDQQAFASYLEPNETLTWVGRPPRGLLFRKSDMIMIPFSLAWGGFTVFWEVMVYNSGAPVYFLVFGAPLVLVGLYITVGRFGYDAMKRKNTVYGLTTERALILSGVFGQSVRSVNLKSTNDISLEQRPNGRGTITFGAPYPNRSFFGNSGWSGPGQQAVPSFELIENVGSVYRMVQAAQRK
jgi:hypothetical protein